ncbi:hypothetical protein CW740_00265 [Kangiella profundi]|uniref:Uncharacterized protein n=1 Tax=Kangiella profundi TaxID=1561924 RepID=A0A2K9ARG8_9GAMM|nr:hypothetical protein [Kangiella profundi]AUD77751.1 hypothetical protein CW740_00265 [Kangiella profundi]GGE92952.1 hypothetical protein GCM10011356_03740 [Kangiella profundi]
MDKKIALITIHGMGDTERDYYTGFYDQIKNALGEELWHKVIFKPLYYQDILQGQQELVLGRMRDQVDWIKLRRFLLYGFSDAASLEYKKRVKNSPYYLTQKMIMAAMDEIFDESGTRPIPVVVVANSLGCQVISSYIWDAQRIDASVGIWSMQRDDEVAEGSPRDRFRRMISLKQFYTLGCNIPIFVAGHKNIEAIKAPTEDFKWYNFYDKDDVLGWPLQPLSPSYEELVEDIQINAGRGLFSKLFKSWNPLSHGQYWQDKKVISHISSNIKQIIKQ